MERAPGTVNMFCFMIPDKPPPVSLFWLHSPSSFTSIICTNPSILQHTHTSFKSISSPNISFSHTHAYCTIHPSNFIITEYTCTYSLWQLSDVWSHHQEKALLTCVEIIAKRWHRKPMSYFPSLPKKGWFQNLFEKKKDQILRNHSSRLHLTASVFQDSAIKKVMLHN